MSGATLTTMQSKAQIVEAYRRNTIIDAAVRVGSRKALDAITMDDVARQAGVSKGTLYLYFRSREAIKRAAEERVRQVLLDEVGRAVDAGGTAEDTLMRLIRRALEMIDGRDDAILVAIALAHESRSQLDERIFGNVRKRLPNVDSPARLWFVLDCLRGMLERRLAGADEQPRERVAASTAAMLLHGIARDVAKLGI